MNRNVSAIVGAGFGIILLSACGSAVAPSGVPETVSAAPVTVTAAPVTVTQPPTTATMIQSVSQPPRVDAPLGSAAAAVTPPAEAAVPSSSAVMPNVLCQNLQDAQDEIQRAGVFFSRSDDASGQARSQLIDRNWIVVGQTPTAGSPVSEMEAILSVVKIGEPNNC